MSVCRTARRRRKQAANGYRHLDKMKRPRYSKVDVVKSERKKQRLLDNIKRMQSGDKK